MSALQGVENIDALMAQCRLPGRLRADYLAFNRFAIIEQKSLDIDVDNKLQRFVDKLVRERGIIGCGQTSLELLINSLPDKDVVRKNLYSVLSKGIDDILAKADKQIRDSRTTFLLAEAVGIVVLLNDNAQFLQPDLVVNKSFDMLRKRRETGEIRYTNIEFVLLISEAHRVIGNDVADLIPIETIFSDAGGNRQIAIHLADVLRREWVAFNQAGYIEAAAEPRNLRTRDPQKAVLLKA